MQIRKRRPTKLWRSVPEVLDKTEGGINSRNTCYYSVHIVFNFPSAFQDTKKEVVEAIIFSVFVWV
jgi:hypothetical protein